MLHLQLRVRVACELMPVLASEHMDLLCGGGHATLACLLLLSHALLLAGLASLLPPLAC